LIQNFSILETQIRSPEAEGFQIGVIKIKLNPLWIIIWIVIKIKQYNIVKRHNLIQNIIFIRIFDFKKIKFIYFMRNYHLIFLSINIKE